MKISEIIELTDGEVICGRGLVDRQLDHAFASDLMSDVLRIKSDNFLLVTGLSNLQSIRTAEFSDVSCVLLVRGKRPTDEMIALATENAMVLIVTSFSMFRASGVLYQAGLKPLY
jgi:predicted transcriptional regulator